MRRGQANFGVEQDYIQVLRAQIHEVDHVLLDDFFSGLASQLQATLTSQLSVFLSGLSCMPKASLAGPEFDCKAMVNRQLPSLLKGLSLELCQSFGSPSATNAKNDGKNMRGRKQEQCTSPEPKRVRIHCPFDTEGVDLLGKLPAQIFENSLLVCLKPPCLYRLISTCPSMSKLAGESNMWEIVDNCAGTVDNS